MSGEHILFLSDYYPPFLGGGQRQTRLLAQELAARGYQIAVATLWGHGMPLLEDDAGIPVYRVKQMRSFLPRSASAKAVEPQPTPFPDPVMAFRLRAIMRAFQPDLVFSYGWITYSALAALLGTATPLLIVARDYGFTCPTRQLVHRQRACTGPTLAKCLPCATAEFGAAKGWIAVLGVLGLRPWLRQRISGVHVISQYVQQVIERDLLAAGCAVPIDIIASFRAAPNAPPAAPSAVSLPAPPFILYVGDLTRAKGVYQLLEAYAALQTSVPLVMIGSRFKDTPPTFPPNVIVIEGLPHEAVMRAWGECLFGVAPSLWPEPLGSVIHEGMSQGKAMIGTTPGGHADMIVDGVSGLLVPGGDVAALSAALRRLLTDEALRQRLGAAAQARSTLFTSAYSVPRWLRLFEATLTFSRTK